MRATMVQDQVRTTEARDAPTVPDTTAVPLPARSRRLAKASVVLSLALAVTALWVVLVPGRDQALPHGLWSWAILLLAAATATLSSYAILRGFRVGRPNLPRTVIPPVDGRAEASTVVPAEELEKLRRTLEQRTYYLSEVYKSAQRIVDTVSHEFRTPLTVIRQYADALHDGSFGSMSEDQRGCVDTIIRRAEELSMLVNDMLDINQLDAGSLRVSRRTHHVRAMLDSVRPALERRAGEHDGRLAVDLGPSLAAVYCDAEKFGRVVVNLVANAFKFSGPGASVTVRSQMTEDASAVQVDVIDNGPGIEPTNLELIFDRFAQVHGDLKQSTHGIGLGLSLVRELVHLNLGDVWVASELGCGSTFSFTVPISEPAEIMARYLERVARLRPDAVYVSLMRAQVDEQTSACVAADVHDFLEDQLRRSDLVLRTHSNAWLVAAGASQSRVEGPILSRLERSKLIANRIRLLEALPDIRLTVVGSWRVDTARDGIIDAFVAEYEGSPGSALTCTA